MKEAPCRELGSGAFEARGGCKTAKCFMCGSQNTSTSAKEEDQRACAHADAADDQREGAGRSGSVAAVRLGPLLSVQVVVLVISPVHEISDGEERGPEVPVVDDLVLELVGQIGEEGRDHLLLVRRDVLDDLTVQPRVRLPPLVQT